MAKKIDSDEVKIITNLINTRIDDVIKGNAAFEKRAEKKLDDTREIVKNEMITVHKRLDKIESKQEEQMKTSFKIEELEKDVKNIKCELKNDIEKVDNKIESHFNDHKKKLPKESENNFMTKVMWSIAGAIGMFVIIFIISKLLGLI